MEVRIPGSFTGGRVVVAASPGDERRSREGEWQPAPSRRREAIEEEAQASSRDALRGRWVVDARDERRFNEPDDRERSREMRRRLEETYRPSAGPAPATAAGRDPLDLVV